MFWIYVLITSLAGTVLAKGPTDCDLNDSSDTHRCFAALGGPLIFHLPTDINIRMSLQKDENILFSFAKNTGLRLLGKHWKIGKNCHDFKNGTFIVDKVSRNDSGDYQHNVYHVANGTLIRKTKIILKILAPVSEPAVSQTCLSPESSGVTCSAEGDEVKFCLTLDGNLLMQTKDHSQPLSDSTDEDLNISSVSININGQLIGILTCQVWNKVSKNETTIHLTACRGFEPLTVPIIVGAVTLFLLLLFWPIVRKLWKKTRPSPVHGGEYEEIIYTAVNMMINRRNSEAHLHGKAN